ncbi:hypothetical protein C5167_017201 [Papaver somniferum]|uniref:Uncharacterized protein n=1 Tax=Papaver somniferum TaxID=3469 RepID=A0A4Y7IIR1_PAPSO|nr:hypothetical protein C5167_017201 [Papaver somniferum]
MESLLGEVREEFEHRLATQNEPISLSSLCGGGGYQGGGDQGGCLGDGYQGGGDKKRNKIFLSNKVTCLACGGGGYQGGGDWEGCLGGGDHGGSGSGRDGDLMCPNSSNLH